MGHDGLKWVNKGLTSGALITYTAPPVVRLKHLQSPPNAAIGTIKGSYCVLAALQGQRKRDMQEERAMLIELGYFMARCKIGYFGKSEIITE